MVTTASGTLALSVSNWAEREYGGKKRDLFYRRGTLDARDRRDQIGQLLEKGGACVRPLVTGARQSRFQRDGVLGRPADVDVQEGPERAPHQQRADQQHHGQRALRGDEAAPQSAVSAAAARPASLDRPHEGAAGGAERRRQGRRAAREQRGQRRPGRHPPVKIDRVQQPPVELGRNRGGGKTDQQGREGQPQQPREGRDRHRLRQQLAAQPPPARPGGGADRELARARQRLRQEQVRGVGARDQQQAGDRADQQEQRPSPLLHPSKAGSDPQPRELVQ